MSTDVNIRNSLRDKGWQQSHTGEALTILNSARENRRLRLAVFDHAVFWLSLLLAIIGNFIVSLSLIPAFLFLKGWELYFVVIVMGLCFGFLFEILVRTMVYLEKRHHAILGLLMPLLAILTLISVSLFSNQLQSLVKLQNPHNPIFIAAVYCISFMLPYLTYNLLRR